jgi:Fur family peroxide stress response transcriptional regulator
MTQFQEQCKAGGLRITPQRLAVYRELISTDEHPSAEWIYQRVRKTYPNISFDTVNRTLLTLANIGAASIVEGTGEAKRFDGGDESHQHFKCIRCRRIVDFHHEPFDDIEIPRAIRGLRVLRKTVYFEGVCDRCEEKNIDVKHEDNSNGGQ